MTRQQADESDQSPLTQIEVGIYRGCGFLMVLFIAALVVAIGYGAVWAWSFL